MRLSGVHQSFALHCGVGHEKDRAHSLLGAEEYLVPQATVCALDNVHKLTLCLWWGRPLVKQDPFCPTLSMLSL